MITQSRLRERLSYDMEAGIFTWKKKHKKCNVGSVAGRVLKTKCSDYWRICIDGKDYLAHRLAYLYIMGVFPKENMDHINHNGCDNKWSNLRIVTHQENNRNMKLCSTNTSGVTGVTWSNRDCVWVAKVQINKRTHYAGSFDSLSNAEQAIKHYRKQNGFHENHGERRVA